MTESTIDRYFSTSRSVKRQRSSSSPPGTVGLQKLGNMPGDDETLGNITRGQLKNDLSALLDEKLSTLVSNLASKEDLDNLAGQVSRLSEQNELLKEEISALKAQGKVVASKLVDLEGRSRRNNLIFKGLKWSNDTKDFRAVVDKFCREVFGSDGTLWINRAHPLGKGGNAVIAHFPNDVDIDYIMSRVRRLRGTGYVVHRDYPEEVRKKRACLMSVRAEVERVAGRRKTTMFFDHLILDGVRFTWEDGQLRAGQLDGADKLQTMFKVNFKDFLISLSQQQPTVRTRNTAARSGSGGTSADAGGSVGGGGGDGASTTEAAAAVSTYAGAAAAVPHPASSA